MLHDRAQGFQDKLDHIPELYQVDQDKTALESLRILSPIAATMLALFGLICYWRGELHSPMALNTLFGVSLFGFTYWASGSGWLDPRRVHPWAVLLGLHAVATVSLNYHCGLREYVSIRLAAVTVGAGLCIQRPFWLAVYLMAASGSILILPGPANEGVLRLVMAIMMANLACLSAHISRQQTLARVEALSSAQVEQNRILEETLEEAHRLGNSLDEEVARRTRHLEETHRKLSATLQEQIHLFEEKTGIEKQLEEGRRLESVGRAAGGAAHDLNNILAILSCSLEFLQEVHPDGPGQEEIAHSIGVMARMGREMLTLSGRHFLRQDGVEARVLDEEWGPLLSRLLGEVYRYEGELHSPETLILCDKQRLFQVLAKLFANAAEAMPGGGRLRLTGRHIAPSDYELVLQDDGPGVEPSLRRMAFEPFFTTKDPSEHSGLGLSTARALMLQIGGRIEIGEGEGGGALVRLRLPAREATP